MPSARLRSRPALVLATLTFWCVLLCRTCSDAAVPISHPSDSVDSVVAFHIISPVAEAVSRMPHSRLLFGQKPIELCSVRLGWPTSPFPEPEGAKARQQKQQILPFQASSVHEFHEMVSKAAIAAGADQQPMPASAQCLLQTACNARRLEQHVLDSTAPDDADALKRLLTAMQDGLSARAFPSAAMRAAASNGSVLPNLWIGTGGDGYGSGGMPMSAQLPFGMVRVGPDTSIGPVVVPWRHTGGYHYCDTDVRAFSHTHLVGAGLMDLGLLGVMPTTDALPTTLLAGAYRSPFAHDSEVVSVPGYYAVTLQRWSVRAELTATSIAYHRYTWAGAAPRVVVLDAGHTLFPDAQQPDTWIAVDAAQRIVQGYVHNNGQLSGRFGGARMYFVAQFHDAFTDAGVFDNLGKVAGATNVTNARAGAYVQLGTGPGPAEFQVAISFVSLDQAFANLADGLARAATFADARALSAAAWADATGRIAVLDPGPASADEQATFATTVAQVFYAPTNFTEAGGVYRGLDGQVHSTGGAFSYYTDFSIWDTHRTEHPLLALVAPDHTADMVRSLLTMAEQGGDLPRWPFLYGYTGCMFGTHVAEIITGAYFCNASVDVPTAYHWLRQQATADSPHGRSQWNACQQHGYCPQDVVGDGVCVTLAYAKTDAALADWATALGQAYDAALFRNHSAFYANVFEPQSRFFCPRFSNGTFGCPASLDDELDWGPYTEGDAYNYRFDAAQLGDGLVTLFGGEAAFVAALDALFVKGADWGSTVLPDPYYWAGNEEDLFFPWMFHNAHAAPYTTKWVRWLLANRYGNRDDGLPGNNDYGTMSAWYTCAALGVFPVAGRGVFFVGAPLFAHTRLSLTPGSALHIVAQGSGGTMLQVTLNGAALDAQAPMFHYADLQPGDNWLRIVLGD